MPKPQRGRTRQPQAPPADSPAELASRNAGSDSAKTRPSGPVRRPTYPEAVAKYEQGMRALQAHGFAEAAEAFRSVITQYPEEKELNDRCRLYLTVCERQLRAAPEPQTAEERLYAATLALNGRDLDSAAKHLTVIVDADPDHDGALYMLGVVHALRDDAAAAVAFLRRAIERNPENRALALQDADLERLLQDEAARTAVESAASSSLDARRAPRPRAGR